MLSKKEHVSITLEDNVLKVTKVKLSGGKLVIQKVEQVRLVSELVQPKEMAETEAFSDIDIDNVLTDDTVFGIEDIEDDSDLIESISEDDDSLGIENLYEFTQETDGIMDLDLVEETERAGTNDLLLYNILTDLNPKYVDISLNFEAGTSIFQILKDYDFNDIKNKDLKIFVEDRLESIYGVGLSKDYYSHTVRDDGALLLVSVDHEPRLLNLVDKVKELYTGRITINQILPDEVVLMGMLRANYELEPNAITAVVKFSKNLCRVFFFKGENLFLVPPIIPVGSDSKRFLNTVFSKILFQLDTGEVPNLDRLLIADNTLEDESITFFKDRFPDIAVEEFKFKSEFIETDGIQASNLSAFTSSIGLAWFATKFKSELLPGIDLVPEYIKDRQKFFKLQWHGVIVLFLILLTPAVANIYFQQASRQISNLENEVNLLTSQVTELQPIVNNYNSINAQLSSISDQIVLLDTLNKGTLRWSTNLNILNSGIDEIEGVWLISVSSTSAPGQTGSGGELEISGIATSREKIAMVADLFEEATLLDVTINEIREMDVYAFTYVVRRIVGNQSIYSPSADDEVEVIE